MGLTMICLLLISNIHFYMNLKSNFSWKEWFILFVTIDFIYHYYRGIKNKNKNK